MHGHTHLMAMRKEGFKPVLTFVDVDRTGSIDDWLNTTIPTTAHVWIEPTDAIARLDLRCFIGLVVSISGTNHQRADEAAAAILKAGAKRVVCAHLRGAGDDVAVVKVTDTEGALAWQD